MFQSQPKAWAIDPNDKELKKVKVNHTSAAIAHKRKFIVAENFSRLDNLIKAVAHMQSAANRLKHKEKPYLRIDPVNPMPTEELKNS